MLLKIPIIRVIRVFFPVIAASPGDVGSLAGRLEGEHGGVGRLERLQELERGYHVGGLGRAGDFHVALAYLAIARPGVLGAYACICS